MPYFTGSVSPVPTKNREEFRDHVAAHWPVFRSNGALRLIETWGVDVPHGKVTDFHSAVDAKDGESIAFSWIEWPDRATADAAWERMQSDSTLRNLPKIPFDGRRMIFGGFSPVFEQGRHSGAGYYQGFLLAVPEGNKTAYAEMAADAWKIFDKGGALGTVEAWGEDVPHGKNTDFYRAAKAEKGEVPVFSWIAWPDRATCDAAARMMEAEMAGQEMPKMPFDVMRMMWGGFEPLYDSGKE